jgi:hypothetical protein
MAVVQAFIIGASTIGGILAGGAAADNQRKELCKNIADLQKNIRDYRETSLETLKAYNDVREDLRDRLAGLQLKIANNSATINTLREDWKVTYQYSQYVCVAVFCIVALLLFLKHNKVLTLNPLATPARV